MGKRFRLVTATILGLALGSSASAPARPAGPGLELTVEARARAGDGRVTDFAVSDGDVLRSGDGLRIRVEVVKPGYLLVILVGSTGSTFIVFPSSREYLERRAPVGGVVEIPPQGEFLVLDDNTGEEGVFAVMADEPVRDPRRLVADLNGAAGDVDAISRLLRERFPEVHRVAFSHIADAPLLGVDPSLPVRAPGLGDGERSPDTSPTRPAGTQPPPPEASFSVVPQAGVDELDEVLSGEGSLIPRNLPDR